MGAPAQSEPQLGDPPIKHVVPALQHIHGYICNQGVYFISPTSQNGNHLSLPKLVCVCGLTGLFMRIYCGWTHKRSIVMNRFRTQESLPSVQRFAALDTVAGRVRQTLHIPFRSCSISTGLCDLQRMPKSVPH